MHNNVTKKTCFPWWWDQYQQRSSTVWTQKCNRTRVNAEFLLESDSQKFYTFSCMTAHLIDEIYTCNDTIRIPHLMISRRFSLVTHSLQLSLCSLLTSTHTSLSRAEKSSDFQEEMTRVRLYKVLRTSDKRSHNSLDKLCKLKSTLSPCCLN